MTKGWNRLENCFGYRIQLVLRPMHIFHNSICPLKCMQTANGWTCSSRQHYGQETIMAKKTGVELSPDRQEVTCQLYFFVGCCTAQETPKWVQPGFPGQQIALNAYVVIMDIPYTKHPDNVSRGKHSLSIYIYISNRYLYISLSLTEICMVSLKIQDALHMII